MIAAALMREPQYKAVLFGGCGFVPDIPSIAAWIERAWSLGFDREGGEQLGFRLVGTSKWIGSAEAATLFRSFGIQARLVAFHAFDDAMLPSVAAPHVQSRCAHLRSLADSTLRASTGRSGVDLLRGRVAGDGKRQLMKGKQGKMSVPASGQSTLPFLSQSSAPAGHPVQSQDEDEQALQQALLDSVAGLRSKEAVACMNRGMEGDEDEGMQRALLASLQQEQGYDSVVVIDDDSQHGDEGASQSASATAVGRGTGMDVDIVAHVQENVEAREDEDEMEVLDDEADQAVGQATRAELMAVVRRSEVCTSASGTESGAGRIGQVAMGTVMPAANIGERAYLAARHAALLTWMAAHFQRDMELGGGGEADRTPHKAPYPLYFQHQGHSRTCVGWEARVSAGSPHPSNPPTVANGGIEVNLLMLDPSASPGEVSRALGPPSKKGPTWPRTFKRGLHTLRHGIYEAVYVPVGSPVLLVPGTEPGGTRTPVGAATLQQLVEEHVYPS